MEWLTIALRFVHIGAGIAWVGAVMFFLAVLDPMMKRIGPEEAGRIGRHLSLRSKMAAFYPVVAILTTVGGLVLYWDLEAQKLYPHSTTQGIVFNIGAAFGLLTFIHGFSIQAPTVKKMQKAARQFEAQPSAEAGQAMGRLARKLSMHTKLTGVLMVVAVAGMTTFRYFA